MLHADLKAIRAALPLLQVEWRRAAIAIGWGALTLVAAVGLAAVSAWLIARASRMPPVLDLTVAVVTVRALGISRGLFRYLDRLAAHEVALRGVANLRERLYAELARGRRGAALGLRRGDLLSRIGADADTLGEVVVRGLIPAAVAAVVSTLTVVAVGFFSPATAAVLLLCLLVAGVAGPILAASAARTSEVALTDARADLAAAVTTLIDGAVELQVSGGVCAARAELGGAEERVQTGRDRAAVPSAAAHAVVLFATGVATIAAVVIGAAELDGGALSAVELAVVVLTPLAAFEAVAGLPGAAVQVTRSAAAARRITDLLAEAAGAEVQVALLDGAAPGVTARHVTCGWDQRTVVSGISLMLKPGRAVVLTGPSGIGKTTIALTLAGLIPAVDGAVEMMGNSAAEPTDVVTLTAEDAHLFATTVLENLRVARGDVTEGEALRVLDRVGLGAWVSRLPDGLGTLVSSDMVSGGERRRLLLARALLSPAPLLILDEPTEHLDPGTADALMRDILTVGRDRGVLVITHQSAGLACADEVIQISSSEPIHR